MTAGPRRIQRRRARGWSLEAEGGAIYVGRPTRWGNPFTFHHKATGLVREPGVLTGQPWEFEGRISGPGNLHPYALPDGPIIRCEVRWATHVELVELYRRILHREADPAIRSAWGPRYLTDRCPVEVTAEDVRRELAGHNLACWCPLDRPCHADVLLAVANPS